MARGASGARGRYAPSPTGELHLGNASTALLAWLAARSASASFVMRIEDLDRARVRTGFADRILEDLRWLGLDWDEGPDRGGPHAPYEQSARMPLYRAAFERLLGDGCLYPCFCSRRDIQAAASAPQEPGEEAPYPGTCRELDPLQAQRRVGAGERHAWRFRVPPDAPTAFDDLVRGVCGGSATPPGDFVVQRSDGVPAYQLAVVVDDAAMGIEQVIRGDDLLASTSRQLLLYDALDVRPPRFGHVPLLFGEDGARLSKRHAGITLRELREADHTAPGLVGRIAHLLGLQPEADSIAARDLIAGFSLARLARDGVGIVVDPARWPPR